MTMQVSVDEYIGLKLKILRSSLGITQNELGERIGVSFQQVQKYEKGVNKISAGKLYEISQILNTSIVYFFDGYDNNANIKTTLSDMNSNWNLNKNNIPEKEVICLIKFFLRIEDKKARNGIVDLARSLSKSENK